MSCRFFARRYWRHFSRTDFKASDHTEGSTPVVHDKVRPLPRAVRLIDRDLRLVEGACRYVAKKYRRASTDADPLFRVEAIQLAARLELIADRMSRRLAGPGEGLTRAANRTRLR